MVARELDLKEIMCMYPELKYFVLPEDQDRFVVEFKD